MTVNDDMLPLSPLDFSVMLLLEEDGAAYGYGIVKGIAEQSRGAVRLAPGNLYQVLDRLLGRGWIRELTARERPADADGRRRYYGLTAQGSAALRAEAARLRAVMPTIERLDLLPARPGR
jgi:DNA-binding PadR family transcriptional regulator